MSYKQKHAKYKYKLKHIVQCGGNDRLYHGSANPTIKKLIPRKAFTLDEHGKLVEEPIAVYATNNKLLASFHAVMRSIKEKYNKTSSCSQK